MDQSENRTQVRPDIEGDCGLVGMYHRKASASFRSRLMDLSQGKCLLQMRGREENSGFQAVLKDPSILQMPQGSGIFSLNFL